MGIILIISKNRNVAISLQSAFTLLELLIVVGIFSILVSTAMPLLNIFTENQNQKSVVRLWLKNLTYVKNEAPFQSSTIRVTMLGDDYSDGFQAINSTNDTVLFYRNTFTSVTIKSDEFSKASPITFNSDGAATIAGILKFEQNTCNFATITINVAGQMIPEFKDC